MATDPASALGRAVANHVLAREEWAREQLTAFAGRVVTVATGPVVATFRVGAGGMLEAVHGAGAAPDLELNLSPLDAPAFLAAPADFDRYVTCKGDAAFAAVIKELAATLPWFVERSFAGAFGPIVGQRLADAGRRLLAFPGHAGGRLAATAASYARDEAGLLARGDEGRTFAEQNAALASRVDALGERVERLAAALAARAGNGR